MHHNQKEKKYKENEFIQSQLRNQEGHVSNLQFIETKQEEMCMVVFVCLSPY